MATVDHILTFVSRGQWRLPQSSTGGAPTLWVPSVTASFDKTQPLPADAERQALLRGVEFYRNARLLPDAQRAIKLTMIIPANNTDPGPDFDMKMRRFARRAPPYEANVSGDGQLGVFEGFTSDIDYFGRQPQFNGIRCDCVTETSSAFAVRAAVTGNESDRLVATNLLNYGHIHAGFHQPWALGAGQPDIYTNIHTGATRPWVVSGDAFGLMAWETMDHAYQLYYSDDNARGFLGAIATAGLLSSERWHSTLATGVLGNLRHTSRSGFEAESSSFASMVDATTNDPQKGWRQDYDSAGVPNFNAHFESYIWAVYLWGYGRSAFTPLLDRAQAGLTAMMENYPAKWVGVSCGIATQRARILLPLAFLVRVNDTALHRQWLISAVEGFMTRRHCEADWCAFKEELSHTGWAGATQVPNNQNYGTFEAPLNQDNDDPVSDFLYTSNFALLGLHEAAAALGNATIAGYEDKLARYIVRIQARSTEQPDIDGAWTRGFDYEKWETWGSDADIGWGAWSIESGWSQSWITTVLGLRQLNTTLWEVGSRINIKRDFETWIPVMFPPAPPAPYNIPCKASLPCVHRENASSPTVEYILLSNLSSLCAPLDGKTEVHVKYVGEVCRGHFIRWTSITTLDPRPGLKPAQCSESVEANPADIPGFFGDGCGVCPEIVTVPTTVCV